MAPPRAAVTASPTGLTLPNALTGLNQRERCDWEADTMIGQRHQAALVTLDETPSPIYALPSRVANQDRRGRDGQHHRLVGAFKGWVHTSPLTTARSSPSMSRWRKPWKCETYFCPSLTIRGNVGRTENANGLLRQYFPKAMGLLRL